MTHALQILGLETSTMSGSVAALMGMRPVGHQLLHPQQGSAQSLAPAIAALLAKASWKPHDIGLIAINLGPGSFTGLRVGVTTAKILAYAIGAEVIGVNTLEVVATQSPGSHGALEVVVDAQRQQVYAARFCTETGQPLRKLRGPRMVHVDTWLASLPRGIAVTGPALVKLYPRLPDGVIVIDSPAWTPHAVTVGQIGFQAYQSGRRDDLWKLVPQYHRQSAAEEKWGQVPHGTQ